MNQAESDAAERLMRLLTEENAALEAMDLTRATGLLAEKHLACEALAAAGASLAAAERLRELCRENQRLLTRAMDVQQRLIALVAAARAPNTRDRRYGANAHLAVERRAMPIALSARA